MMMNTEHTDANRLNDIWDARLSHGKAQGDQADDGIAGIEWLLEMDAATPAPEPKFLAILRSRLVSGAPAETDQARKWSDIGIVPAPFALDFHPRGWSRRAAVAVVAAMLAILILGSGLTFNAGGRPALDLPTAQASSTSVVATPTATTTSYLPAT
jgi:hypothetical protein